MKCMHMRRARCDGGRRETINACMAMAPDGETVYVGSFDIKLYAVATGFASPCGCGCKVGSGVVLSDVFHN